MASNINVNSIANTIYHGAVVGGLSISYSIAHLDRLSVEDATKLTALVGGSLATQQWLVNQGILPGSIMNDKSQKF